MIAALYIDPKGPYCTLPDVDPWDAERDASLYAGPWPVVAHPPCGRWSVLKGMCKQADEVKALAPLAVEQVRRWGGILEHPAQSELFWFDTGLHLPSPGGLPDAWGGRTIQVDQCRWGHPARKKTWLYMVGIDPAAVVIPPWKEPTAVIDCSSGRKGPNKGVVHVPKAQRHLTPSAFAEWLVALARTAKGRG